VQKDVEAVRKEAKAALVAANPRAKVKDSDYVFITFIVTQLPDGIVGLLIAVMFAAALGSKAGELNALGTTTTIDLSTIPNGGIARITLTGNITVQLSGGTDGQKFVIELIQDGTGSRTVSLSGTYFRFGTDITSFTATTTASKMDRVGCVYNSTANQDAHKRDGHIEQIIRGNHNLYYLYGC
jgi:hypothetical protein